MPIKVLLDCAQHVVCVYKTCTQFDALVKCTHLWWTLLWTDLCCRSFVLAPVVSVFLKLDGHKAVADVCNVHRK